MKNNAVVSLEDRFYWHLKDSAEVEDLFGCEYLDDFGHEVDLNLIDRYKKAKQEWDEVQKLLKLVVDNQPPQT